MKQILLLLACLFSFNALALAADLPITSDFGWRVHPITGAMKFHSGVDLGYPAGTGILALYNGTVVQSGDFGDGYGNQVLIYHSELDSYSRYAHCSELYVTAGDMVTGGQVIGAVGSTGNATGPHLHLEYIINTDNGYQYINPVDLFL